MFVERRIKQKIKMLAEDFPAIGILGPRQVGKTTLVKHISADFQKPMIYLDMEKPSDLSKLDDPEMFLRTFSKHCIIIDEVQRKPDLFPLLRAVIDENRIPLRFILLGSASPNLIRDSSESLAGRIAFVELLPFDLLEIGDLKNMESHHFYGGYPNSFLTTPGEKSKIWLESFIQTYIERDLPLLGMRASPTQVRRLWEMLAWQNGQLINYASLSNSLGTANQTIKGYIDFLEEAFLIRRLQPFHFNIGKRLVKSPKLYIRDTGILHRLLRIDSFEQLLGSPFAGSSWENYVIEQIQAVKHSDIDLFFYRTYHGAECDLVFVKGLKPIACAEIKFSSAPKVSKGFYNCIADLKTKKNFIIAPVSDRFPVRNDIWVYSLKDFLTNGLEDIKFL